MSEVIKKLADPTLRWFVSKLFGTRVYGDVTVPNQTLYICDELICIPTRFSEYFKWWNPSTNSPGNRMFDREEAWDHTVETNPSTAYPRDCRGLIVPVYAGYYIGIDLTDGSNRVVVHVVRKRGQMLVFNMGYYATNGVKYTINIPVKVYFPPSALNLAYTTNGTVQADGVMIEGGQYVLFYPSTQSPEEIDTDKGLFRYSPAGSSPSYQYELKYSATPLYSISPGWYNIDVPQIYTGIKVRSDTRDLKLLFHGRIRSGARSPINVSGFDRFFASIQVYDSDPYASAGTWAESNIPLVFYIGWAEDQDGNPISYLMSTLAYKHTTKKEARARLKTTIIYDMLTNEAYWLSSIHPINNIFSYGRAGAVTYPFIMSSIYFTENATKAIAVRPDDTYIVKTTDATTCYEWNDGYGFCNVFSDRAVCFEYLGFYTDDPNISIANPKYMGVNRCDQWPNKRAFADQIKPYMDRTLYADKTYFVMARIWVESPDLSDEEYANRIKKYAPKVLSSNEWSNLVTNIPPYSLRIFGIPETARVIYYTYLKTVTPGSNITISGSVTGLGGETHANKKIKILIIDQQNNIVTQTSTYTDGEGNFSINLTAPQTPGNYKVVIIATNEEQPIS
ncbi:MAG: carboxypeptidase-like regulatory domain-containing protein [candidate division WOR-3 bacterium]